LYKVLQRIVDARFTEHANSHRRSSRLTASITETALVKVHNDLITAVDQGNVGALALLDFSSAFDTVDHQLLLTVLQKRFAVTNIILRLPASSYLADRTQTVHLYTDVSDTIRVYSGVPQGSVVGPKTFIAYVEETDEIFKAHGLHHHGLLTTHSPT